MAKDRKSLERSRQAKIMRQKSREKARRRQEEMRGTVDTFQFFRRDLLPPDVSPTTWTRAQILHDLNDHHPGDALARFVHLMVDPEQMRSNPDAQAGYMTMAMNLWRIALAPAEAQAGVIDELATAVAKTPEEQESFRSFARGMVQQHQTMFPRLHARVAQRRSELAEEAAGASGRGRAEASEPDLFTEYARPLLDAAGHDVAAIQRAVRLATFFTLAAREPLGNRAAALATLRERLPQEDRPYFDETAPMMMRRYRELFESAGGSGPSASAAPAASAANGSGANEEEAATALSPDAETPETPESVPAAEADGPLPAAPEADDPLPGVPPAEGTPESPGEKPQEDAEETTSAKRSLLGGLFRRGG
jgi:hypothetical protein